MADGYTGNPYDLIPELERLGEQTVRIYMNTRYFGDPDSIARKVAEGWLALRHQDSVAATARNANRIAIAALIVSLGVALFEFVGWLIKL